MVNKIILLIIFMFVSMTSLTYAGVGDIPAFRSSYDVDRSIDNNILEEYNGKKVGFDSLKETFMPSIMLLTTFTPDDYDEKLAPSDSNDPYKRYSSTYFGDDTSVDVGLVISNFLLGSAVKKVMGDNVLLAFNAEDGVGIDIAVKPIYWMNLKLELNGLDTERINSELRVEMTLIKNLTFYVKYSDSIDERKPALEVKYYF